MNLKKIYNPFKALILAAAIFTSCDGLERENFDQLTPDNFPKSSEDVTASITAIYNDFGNIWMPRYLNSCHFMVNTLSTDELISAWGGGWQEIDRYYWTENSGYLKGLYTGYTKAITKSTILLDVIEKTEIANETLKSRYEAEVRVLRAYFAFQLLDLFGPVPLVTDIDIALDINNIHTPERPTKEEVLNFITTELSTYAEKLPAEYTVSSDYGRISKGAAYTMLMKVHLYKKDYANVVTTAQKIEDLSVYQLLDNYNDVFSTATEGLGNKEVILAMPKIADGYGTSWYAVVLPQQPKYRTLTDITVNIWGGLKTPWSFYDTYEEGNDDRLGHALIRYYTDVDGNEVDFKTVEHTKAIGASPKKYVEDPDHMGNFQGNDIVRYRYADVILAKAEALNELNGPTSDVVDLVNQIRNRVHTTPIEATGWTKSTMRDYILAERGRELFCEGHRRQDLIRHGKLIQKVLDLGRNDAKPHHTLFPIPQSILNENPNIVQNPEY